MSGRQFRIDRGGIFADAVARAPDRRPATHKLPENSERHPDALARRIVQRNVATLLAP